MNELKIIDFHGKPTIDSREVAVIVEKNHKDLLRDIRGYVEVMENSNERKIAPVDFFISSNYVDGKGEARPCYLITKKGCDMIANKTTGKKGVLFTAAYVSAFEEMRQALSVPRHAALPKRNSTTGGRGMQEERRLSIRTVRKPALWYGPGLRQQQEAGTRDAKEVVKIESQQCERCGTPCDVSDSYCRCCGNRLFLCHSEIPEEVHARAIAEIEALIDHYLAVDRYAARRGVYTYIGKYIRRRRRHGPTNPLQR